MTTAQYRATVGAKAPRKKRQKPEEGLQRSCADVLATLVPKPPAGPAWTAVNPVSAKSKAAAGISKAMGLRKGWNDIQMLQRGRLIVVEFKATRGRVDADQKAMHQEIADAGGYVHICRSLEEFVAILDHHGIPCRIDRASLNSRRSEHARKQRNG